MVTKTKLRPYPAYKPSGVDWLDDIPAHWTDAKLGRLASAQSGGTPSMAKRDYWVPEVPWVSSKDMKRPRISNSKMWVSRSSISDGRTGLAGPGSILMVVRSGILRHTIPVAIVDREVAFNQDIKAFALLTNALLPEYFAGLVRGNQSSLLTMWRKHGATVESLEHSWMMDTRVPLPPLDEQRAIADFLDVMDARITRFVAARKRMIALLEEQKAAIITQAVTRGLDPDVPLKPSGVDWLGDIPAHWEVAAIARNWKVYDCKHLTVPFVEPNEETYPLASVVQSQAFELDLFNAKHTTEEWYRVLIEGGREPKKGDLIFCRNVSVGSAAYVTADEQFAMGQDVCLLSTRTQDSRFLNYCLKSGPVAMAIERTLVGSTFRRINVAQVRSIVHPLPPVLEQHAIVGHIETEMDRIANVIGKAKGEIDLIKEYRARLISDVVTGKLDVWAVEIPAIEEVVDFDIDESLEREENVKVALSGEDR